MLQHLMGYLENYLSSDDKQELLGLIEDYRQGLLPLIVREWVHQQVYLHPHPRELMFRNHV